MLSMQVLLRNSFLSPADKCATARYNSEQNHHYTCFMSTSFGIDTLIVKSWVLFRASLKSTYWYAFITALIIQLMLLYIMQSGDLSYNGNLSIQSPFIMALFALLFAVVNIVANALIMIRQFAQLHGKAYHLGNVWHELRTHLSRIIVAGLIVNALTFTGFILYLIPGIIIYTLLYFYLPFVLFKNYSAIDALKQSFEHTKERFWLILTIVIFTMLINAIPSIANLLIGFVAPNMRDAFGVQEGITVILSGFTIAYINALVITAFLHVSTTSNSK